MRLESPLRQRRLFVTSNPSILVRFGCHWMPRVAGLAALALMTFGMSGHSSLRAADATWIGSTGTQAWNAGTNWTGGTAPGATDSLSNGDTATFNSNVAGTAITIDPNRNIKNLSFVTGAAGAISIGSGGVNGGEALLLTSGGALTTNLGTTAIVTVNSPLIVQATSPTGNGSYTFTNNSASADNDTNAYKIFLNGNISGGATTGTITLNFGGSAGNRSTDSSANEVNGVISNGLAGAVAVNVSNLSNQRGVWKFTNANNSYTGNTTLTLGTLIFTSIANAGVNSSLGAGSAIIMGGGTHLKYAGPSAATDRAISGSGAFYNQTGGTTLTLNGTVAAGLTFRGSGNFAVNGRITGAAGVSRTDGGTVFLNNDTNSFTGDLAISDGAFRAGTIFNNGVNSAIGNTGRIILGQGQSGTIGRLEYSGNTTSTDRLVVMRNDTAGSSGRGVIEVLTAGQTLTLTGGVRTIATAAGTEAANIADLTLRGAGNGEIQGQIGGNTANAALGTAIKIVKEGLGTWTLSGANNYTRETTVSAGILNIRSSNALGAVLSNETTPTAAGAGTTVANNATLQLQNNISVGAEQLTLSGNGASGQSGALVNVSGVNSFAGNVILAANATIASDAGRLNLTSATALNGSAASRTLTLGGAGDGSISAGLGANISTLTKNGTGLWTLAGTSAHTGTTTVNAGTLNVTGSLGTSAVTVASGGTFSMAGTHAGALTVANGGTLAIGNAEVAGSTGTLTVTGATVLNNTSVLNFDLGSSSDQLVANGALTLDGLLSVTKGAGFSAGTYKVIDYTSTLTDNGLGVQALVGYDAVLAMDTANTDVNLVVTAIAGQYWDGGDTAADGTVDGGSGVWTNAGSNWTNSDGSTNTTWAAAVDKVAFFEGATGGTVTVQDAVSVAGLQFGKSYTLANGGGSLQITSATTEMRVTSGATATIEAPVTGAGGINKTGEGTLVFTAAAGGNVYSGPTLVSNGTLKIGVTNTLPTSTALTLGAGTSGSVGPATPVATLDLSTASQQVGSLQVASNSTSNNTVTIGAGQTLSVTGAGGFRVGIVNTAKAQTHVVFTGAGSLVVNNTAANFESGLQTSTSSTVIPGATTPFDSNSNTNTSSLNLAALGSFTANVNEFRVAHGLNNTSTLTLSNTANNITANTVNIANSVTYNSGTGLMILGTGTNVISTNTLNIGVAKGGGTLRFASQTPGSLGTVVIGGKTTAAVDIIVASSLNVATGASPGGTLNLTGHVATVTADDLIIGKRSSSGAGGTDGKVFFDGGTFTANKVEIGTMGGEATGDAKGELTVSGGTFTVNTAGSITLGTFANTTNVGKATATLTISGGTFISNADILEGGGAQATTTNTTTTLNLSGGTLDMTGKNIGSATNTINNINLTAGTLKDVGEINGGAALTKTSTGTLTLQGDNGFTGGITASAGTLLVSNTPATSGTGSATGSGNVSISSTATLGGNGRITGSVTLASGATLAPGGNATTIAAAAPPPGLGTDTGTLIIAGNLTVASNANLAFNLKTSGSHGLTTTFDPVTNRLTGVSGTSLDGGNDRLIVQGTTTFDPAATITVTLGTGYTGGYQDTFDLFDWTGVTLPTSYYDDASADGIRTGGTADNALYNLDLPDLSSYNAGWFWDVSQFGTTGVIAIVPEPGRATLALLGLVTLMLRRRRKAAV